MAGRRVHGTGGRRSVRFSTGVLVALAGICLPCFSVSAVAGTANVVVALGTHRFGHLTPNVAIVARVGADAVGFEGAEGGGNGPWSFDVAADGSVWLLDEVNDRVLMWEPDRADRVAKVIPLPNDVVRGAADVAIGPARTIYASCVPVVSDPRKRLRVIALSPNGRVLWTTPTDIDFANSLLRFGPDGTLYWTAPGGASRWTPVADPAGYPLSLAEQRGGSVAFQPIAAQRLLQEHIVSLHEIRITLLDHAGTTVRSWDVTSGTDLYPSLSTSALVDGDPVVMFIVQKLGQPGTGALDEYLVLRLAPGGATPVRVALDSHAVPGDPPVTGLRVGPDGSLYELRSDIDTGVSIARYSLGASTAPSPTPSPTTSPTSSPTPTPTTHPSPSASTLPPSVVAAPTPASRSTSAGRNLIAGFVLLVLLAALGAWIIRRRRRVQTPSPDS